MTIREEVFSIINDIKANQDKWDGHYLSDKLVELTTWYCSLSSHIAELQGKHATDLDLASSVMVNGKEISSARAKIKAQAMNTYAELLKALALEKSLVEQIRSLKIYIRVRSEEQRIVSFNG